MRPFGKLATDKTKFKVCIDNVYLSPALDLFKKLPKNITPYSTLISAGNINMLNINSCYCSVTSHRSCQVISLADLKSRGLMSSYLRAWMIYSDIGKLYPSL